jgi:uncharacterized protein
MNEPTTRNIPRAARMLPPLRIVVDGRVLRSAVWGGRSSTLIVDAWLEERVHFCVTENIMSEYFEILRRVQASSLSHTVIQRLRSGEAVRAYIVGTAHEVCPEDRWITCAQQAGAVAVVTHDEALLDLVKVGGVHMDTPGGFARRCLVNL